MNDEYMDMHCCLCNEQLVHGESLIEYLGASFPVMLPLCPKCGMVYLDEVTVHSRILELEKALEDK